MVFDTAITSSGTLGCQIRNLMSVSDLPGDHCTERETAAEVLDSLVCSWRYLVCRLTKKGKRELRAFWVSLLKEYPPRNDSQEKFLTIHKHIEELIRDLEA